MRPREMRITVCTNGVSCDLTIEPSTLLLDLLRDQLGLTGAKRSCDEQVCGACTVLVDGLPVSSCTYLAYEVAGREVLTIEGLADEGDLHPVQRAFIEHGGVQCGFCTPGMILTAKALLDRSPAPTREEIINELHGNLCRCTGYYGIVRAIEAASASPGVEDERVS